MATEKITKRLVDGLRPEARLYAVYDTELKGFGVRVMPSGLCPYFIEYRPDGGGRNVTKTDPFIVTNGVGRQSRTLCQLANLHQRHSFVTTPRKLRVRVCSKSIGK